MKTNLKIILALALAMTPAIALAQPGAHAAHTTGTRARTTEYHDRGSQYHDHGSEAHH